jgi:hypothetical protein
MSVTGANQDMEAMRYTRTGSKGGKAPPVTKADHSANSI